MASEQDLHEVLLGLFRRTGQATGYWPNYFRRSVRARGGLKVAKKLLAPRQVSSGFDKLVAARRADLSVEWIAVSERFSHLFTPEELGEAQRRLDQLPATAFPQLLAIPHQGADELSPDSHYVEGSVMPVMVNRYERNAAARAACIRHHGYQCTVCQFDFERRYGKLGKDFIHVHHTRPLRLLKSSYRVNPKTDLVPICPNCHAMLHRSDPPLDVEELRTLLK